MAYLIHVLQVFFLSDIVEYHRMRGRAVSFNCAPVQEARLEGCREKAIDPPG
jgi:hypothetical protein